MTTLYVVLEANIASAPTRTQWETMLEAARDQDFPRFLWWASAGHVNREPFNSRKFSQGVGSNPAQSRHRFYAFGLEIEAQSLVTDIATPRSTEIRDAFITGVNYLRGRGIAPYSNLGAALTTSTVGEFVRTNAVTVEQAGLMFCRAYEERFKVQLQDTLWPARVSTNDLTRVQNTLEFSLRQAGVAAGFTRAQAGNLRVAAIFIGEDAGAQLSAYLVANAAAWYVA